MLHLPVHFLWHAHEHDHIHFLLNPRNRRTQLRSSDQAPSVHTPHPLKHQNPSFFIIKSPKIQSDNVSNASSAGGVREFLDIPRWRLGRRQRPLRRGQQREVCSARAGNAEARNGCEARAAAKLRDGCRREDRENGSGRSRDGFSAIYGGIGQSGQTWRARPGAPIYPPHIWAGYEGCQSAWALEARDLIGFL